uniref:Ig-like domain-containing protein n=1 Tax=Angiostrongylus cantonensis TaxID=6313 RepID=A0A0K0DEZ1_ANGCA
MFLPTKTSNEIYLLYSVRMTTCLEYKDGQRLVVENRMLQYTDRKGVARLNIMNSTPADSGEYSCEAVNMLGKAITECRIKVIGSRGALELEVDGMPAPMIEWFHDGTLVSESRTLRTSYNGRVAVLKIYEVQAEHHGQYICKVCGKLIASFEFGQFEF